MPRLSIGLPVYNGERFLRKAMDSILTQSFEDFELIISDNASTDATQEICLAYQSRDPRVRYYRNGKNLGASENYNRVFDLSAGEYFKWAAHDDVLARDCLLKCVRVLDQDPSVALCYPLARVIDEEGEVVEDYDIKLRTDSSNPRDRFYDLIWINHWCYQIFGVIRTSVLKQTPLMGKYAAADRALLAEIALLGRFHEIQDRLFFPRRHPGQFTQAHTDRQSQTAWFDPAKRRRMFLPKWRIGLGYLAPLGRAPLNWRERSSCYVHIARWFLHNRRILAGELAAAAKHVLRRSSLIDRMLVAARRV